MNDRSEFVAWMDRLRAAMFDAVTEGDVREMMANLVAKAKQGDRAAMQLVLSYCVGPPNPAPLSRLADETPPPAERERIQTATLKILEAKKAKEAARGQKAMP